MKRAALKSIFYLLFLLIVGACGMGRNSKNTKAIFVGQTGTASTQSTSETESSSTNSSLHSTSANTNTGSTTTSNPNNDILTNATWIWTNSSAGENGTNYIVLPPHVSVPAPTPIQLVPTTYFDLDLLSNQWVEFYLPEESVLIAHATAKFSYANGGGGSAVIDLQRNDTTDWVNTTGIGHCGSDSIGSATGAGSDDTSVATCQERLAPGRYRIKAMEGHFSGTTVTSFSAHFSVLRRIVPEQFNGVFTISGALPGGTVLFDSPLFENAWKEIFLSQKGVLYAQALSSFTYKNGGGGTSGIDLQVLQANTWVSVLWGTDTCSTNSYVHSTGNTDAVEATASCLQTLNAGQYRVRAWETKENSRTSLNYFRASALVLAQ